MSFIVGVTLELSIHKWQRLVYIGNKNDMYIHIYMDGIFSD